MNFIQRLEVIDRLDDILKRLLHNDKAKLNVSDNILTKLKTDIKQIGIDALKEVNEWYFQVNQIIFDSRTKARQPQNETKSK